MSCLPVFSCQSLDPFEQKLKEKIRFESRLLFTSVRIFTWKPKTFFPACSVIRISNEKPWHEDLYLIINIRCTCLQFGIRNFLGVDWPKLLKILYFINAQVMAAYGSFDVDSILFDCCFEGPFQPCLLPVLGELWDKISGVIACLLRMKKQCHSHQNCSSKIEDMHFRNLQINLFQIETEVTQFV